MACLCCLAKVAKADQLQFFFVRSFTSYAICSLEYYIGFAKLDYHFIKEIMLK